MKEGAFLFCFDQNSEWWALGLSIVFAICTKECIAVLLCSGVLGGCWHTLVQIGAEFLGHVMTC